MGQLQTLLKARWRATSNRLSGSRAQALPLVAGLLAAVLTLLTLGHLIAPSLLAPPIDLATPVGLGADELPAGAAALEAAFWLTALASSVLTFRVMELLFRRADIRAVEPYPIALGALFVDRLLAASLEALGTAALLSLFFVPLAWHGGGLAALLSVGLLAGGLLVGSILALAVMLIAGASQLETPRFSKTAASKKRRRTGDVYGGAGQVFIFAPGAALGFAVVTILFMKLVIGEVLRNGAVTPPFTVGMSIIGGMTLFALLLAARHFTASFPAMAARFREADFVGFESTTRYQKSAFTVPRRAEGLLRPGARAVFRAEILQYSRRFMMARYLYGLAWFGAGIALWSASPEAFPAWAVALLPAIGVAILANPWHRIRRLGSPDSHALPVSHSDRLTSSTVFISREVLIASVPYAALVLLIRGALQTQWTTAALAAAAAILTVQALNGLMTITARLLGHHTATALLVPVLGLIALLAAGITSLVALLIISAILTLGQAAAWIKYDTDTIHR